MLDRPRSISRAQDNWPAPCVFEVLAEVICAREPRLIGLIRHYRAPGHGAALVGNERGNRAVRHAGEGLARCDLRRGDHFRGFAGSLILEQTDFVFRHTATGTNRL